MVLTGKAREDFNKVKPFYFNWLPESLQLLIIYRWIVTEGAIPVDLWCRENNGYDYSVQHPDPTKDVVYVSRGTTQRWTKNFDDNIRRGLTIANIVYNDPEIEHIPRQFFDL